TSLVVFVVAWVVLGTVHRIIRSRVTLLAEHRKAASLQVASKVVGQTRSWFLLLVALFVSARLVVWPPAAQLVIERIVVLGLLLQLALWASAALDSFLTSRR